MAQHLVLYYEAALRGLLEGAQLRSRAGPVMRTLLRWFLLPHILFHQSFPFRASSPPEIRPTGEPPTKETARNRLAGAAAALEDAVARAESIGTTRLLHPYFGTMRPLDFLRLSAIHLDHHRRQLERAR